MKEKSDIPQPHNHLIPLSRVTPTNTLFFLPKSPLQCEKQTAQIRNHTVESLEENDIRAVACRYLQNRSGENHTRTEIIFWGIVVYSFLFLFFQLMKEFSK